MEKNEAVERNVKFIKDATKSESQQVVDRGISWGVSGGLKPPYDPSKLAELQEANGTHAVCIRKKAKREVGHGFKIVPVEDVENPSESEYEIVKDFWRGSGTKWLSGLDSNIPSTPLEVLELARIDWHGIGWMAIELIYNDLDELVGMAYCPAETVRVRKGSGEEDERVRGYGYIQKKGSEITFFGEAGDRVSDEPIYVDRETGEVSDSADEIGEVANEILYIPNPSGLTDYYGVPAWVAEMNTLAVDSELRRFNYDFFKYDAIPQFLIHVKNGRLSEESKEQLSEMVLDLREKAGRRVAILEAEALSERGLDVQDDVEIVLEDLRRMGDEDGSFSELRRMNEHDIASVHEVPHVLVNRLESASRATSKEQIKDFIQDVIKPNQKRLEARIFKIILQQILEVDDWKVEFKAKGGEDELRDVEIAEKRINASQGLITVNQMLELLDFPPDEDYGDMRVAELSEILSPAQEMGRLVEGVIDERARTVQENLEIEQELEEQD